jgi:hypothetical protein
MSVRGETPGHLEPVRPGELDVEQNQEGGGGGRRPERRVAVRRLEHVESAGFEQLSRARPEARVVVDDQDGHGHSTPDVETVASRTNQGQP